MPVNSSFTSFFSHRLRMYSGIAILLATVLIGSSFTKPADADLRAKQVNLIIRDIGHRLLLQAGDSTSRVMPVKESKAGTFLLRFENEFAFKHDSLMALSHTLLPKTEFPSGYTVTVHDCLDASIVYGFQFNNATSDILACKGRSEPLGCYTIEFTFPDFYDDVEEKKAVIDQPTSKLKSALVDPHEADPKVEESKGATADHSTNQLAEELKSVKIEPQVSNLRHEESRTKTTTLDFRLAILVSGGILVLLGVTLFVGRFGKILAPLKNQNHAIIKEPAPELPALGKFLFDASGHRLMLGSEVTSLTDKECKILELLNDSFGELIPRETLMQKVWIDEGVITGRSLDMFVSKLRKKLSGDPELRITNVHGKGYKLEVSESQNLN